MQSALLRTIHLYANSPNTQSAATLISLSSLALISASLFAAETLSVVCNFWNLGRKPQIVCFHAQYIDYIDLDTPAAYHHGQ